jgi:hypothetical protein
MIMKETKEQIPYYPEYIEATLWFDNSEDYFYADLQDLDDYYMVTFFAEKGGEPIVSTIWNGGLCGAIHDIKDRKYEMIASLKEIQMSDPTNV